MTPNQLKARIAASAGEPKVMLSHAEAEGLLAWLLDRAREAEQLEGELAKAKAPVKEKRAPVQGLTGGIPWSLHLKAYDAYAKRYGRQDALIDLEGRGCRGGFSTGELDMFVPGWREELSELTALRHRAEAAEARLSALTAQQTATAGGGCSRPEGCVCGGDTPRVREGCFHYVKPAAALGTCGCP